ncbi:endonuclease/exonuclease/phosphatase family protein [Streptomyces sp. NPDC046985]|uniref:endonuclease/exonuclease/phosphatase family protein n=1 Tax=Streptomyces sp. NPDC046985 TaxID=3155377 RepID=UPI0033CFAD4E
MRCATFNVLHGREIQRDGRPPRTAHRDPRAALAAAVAGLDVDVLALQEVDRLQERSGGVDQAAAAAAAMGARDWRHASALHGRAVPDGEWVADPAEPGARLYGPDDGDPVSQIPSHGVALLSRSPVRAWRVLRLPPAPVRTPLRVPGKPGLTWGRDQPRAAVAAVLEGERGPFTAVAVHLSFVPGWNVRQLDAVRRWIADLPRPQVLLGDFNLVGAVPRWVPNAPSLARSRRVGERWRDTARVPTYPAHRPVVRFDHVLVTGLGGQSSGAAHAPRTAISDHRPLVVELPL